MYAPGAILVLNLCAGIYERFEARRELSGELSTALTFVKNIAQDIAKAKGDA